MQEQNPAISQGIESSLPAGSVGHMTMHSYTQLSRIQPTWHDTGQNCYRLKTIDMSLAKLTIRCQDLELDAKL